MSKFVKNSSEINAFQGLAVMEDGRHRPAKTRGGRSSRSGKTATPTWVEEGAFVLLRKDVFLAKIWMSLKDSVIYDLQPYFFEGHGTDWREVKEVNIQGLEMALSAWMKFRKEGANIPPSSTFEEKLAREYSLVSFRTEGFITQFEALELLPRWSTWAELEQDEEDEDGVAARIWAERGHAWTADIASEVWHFVPEGCIYTWKDKEGWEYTSQLSCVERRWHRQRRRIGEMEIEKVEDSWIWEKI